MLVHSKLLLNYEIYKKILNELTFINQVDVVNVFPPPYTLSSQTVHAALSKMFSFLLVRGLH